MKDPRFQSKPATAVLEDGRSTTDTFGFRRDLDERKATMQSPLRIRLRTVSSRPVVFALVSIAIFLASAAILFSEIPSTPFHTDECGWVSSAYYYTNLVLAANFDPSKWDKDELSTFGSLNPHVGEWLIGIPLKADPETRSQAFFALYHYGVPFQQNIHEGRIPSQNILRRARSASAFFGALSCVVVFAIGYSAFDVWIGLIAVALLLGSALFRTSATQAITDVFYTFFLLCGCLVLVLFSKAKGGRLTVVFPVICGVIAGLACSVKITGLVVIGAAFLPVVVQNYGLRTLRQRRRELTVMVGMFSFTAVLTVYALNPFFWPSWNEIHARTVFHELRLMWRGGLAAGITHSHGRYPQLKMLSQPLEFPRLYFRWADLMQRQQPVSKWQHNHLLDIHLSLFSPRDNLPGEFVFIGIGLVALLRKKRLAFLPTFGDARTIPVIYLLVNYLFILLFIKLNWSRYYMPTMIAGHLIAAVGVYAVVLYLYHSLVRLRRFPPAQPGLLPQSRESSVAGASTSTSESSTQIAADH